MDKGALAEKNDEWIKMDDRKDNPSKKQSRFQVAKVDFAGEAEKHSDEEESSDERDEQSWNVTGSYDTHNVRSLRHYTREALPRLDHYRNVMSVHGHMARPTLDELHNATLTLLPDQKQSLDKSGRNTADEVVIKGKGAVKLGWIQGVFVRCVLNIWGVILFLRLSWVVGEAGIGLGCVVILLASVVTMLTTLSMSAICTNGEVRGGGTYYMISRSLGPEFGGSIGLIFSLANAVAIALYVVGFSESVRDLLKQQGTAVLDGGLNDIRIVSGVTVIVLLGIAIIGTEWESKAQMVLLVILLVAMIDFVVGSMIPPNLDEQGKGYVGWSTSLMTENMGPRFSAGENFFTVFSVYFPAATGILAGANISGDLADPQVAIPKGTYLAIIVTTISYVFFAFVAGSVTLREANGIPPINITLSDIRNCTLTETGKCEYGLLFDSQVMELVSAFGPLVYAGIFAATLSSALASLVSAPKVFQALCKDKIFPHIEVFAKGYGKSNEPRRGYLLACAIALGCVAIGELNAIAPIISNFFMAAYALINFSCFHASYAKSPGFRPAFKYYNMWLSLVGAIVCVFVMFIMNWQTALITFAVILGLYIYISYRKPDVNWGSSTQAQTYKDALNAVFRLNMVQEHVKNYRPQILVLTGDPSHRPPLVDFAYSITKKLSLLICGNVTSVRLTSRTRNVLTNRANQWLQRRKVKAFYALVKDEDFAHGVRSMLQVAGVGKLKPNVVMLGYKTNWETSDPEDVVRYFTVIHDVLDMYLSVCILRLSESLDYSDYADMDSTEPPVPNGKQPEKLAVPGMERENSALGFPRNVSSAQLSMGGSSREPSPPGSPSTQRAATQNNKGEGEQVNQLQPAEAAPLVKEAIKDVPHSINQFLRKQKKGTIDVWWLYDDGGLTMLIPYLLTTRHNWSGCKLRVFSLANKKEELDREQRNMASLLSKFRIEYSDVTVIPDIVRPPSEASKKQFEELIKKWRQEDEDDEHNLSNITDSELLALKDKTNRHLRLRELLLQHSMDATLVAMTLPMPRKSTVSAPMYMAWLETLTRGMPPFLLIRGNQTSVLTFYS
ncbi:solute carrier family 12 member 2-like [Ornithodoros turicata]|uniref:solute carrier family 12 member 2-like n=1 Tax=Ornithodoros turicata TaxID=34597 RepID=UPI003138E03C